MEISASGSGEGPRWATASGYSTARFSPQCPVSASPLGSELRAGRPSRAEFSNCQPMPAFGDIDEGFSHDLSESFEFDQSQPQDWDIGA